MGRELQKHKNRSSINKVKRKPKSKKRILSNHIIAENWDQSQTLAQNYKRLGLAARLNKTTGGIEKTAADLDSGREEQDVGVANRSRKQHGLVIAGGSRKAAQTLDLREIGVERDAKTGQILRVLDSASARANPLHDPLNDLDSDSEVSDREMFDQHGNAVDTSTLTVSQSRTAVVERLQREASKPVVKYKHKQSEGEREFVEALLEKYGEDYGKMARDMKINYMQRSEADLKRRIRKWKESGGKLG